MCVCVQLRPVLMSYRTWQKRRDGLEIMTTDEYTHWEQDELEHAEEETHTLTEDIQTRINNLPGWSKALQMLLATKHGNDAFREHIKSEYSIELLKVSQFFTAIAIAIAISISISVSVSISISITIPYSTL